MLLLATAGLRLLSRNTSEAILMKCRAALLLSGFKFEPGYARVLPGQLEGLYAWAAVNYAAGTLQVRPYGPMLGQAGICMGPLLQVEYVLCYILLFRQWQPQRRRSNGTGPQHQPEQLLPPGGPLNLVEPACRWEQGIISLKRAVGGQVSPGPQCEVWSHRVLS